MKKLLSVTLFVIPFIVCSQNKYTLSGYVKDSLSGETLIGSTISVAGLSKGITSNSYGFFSISLKAGTYTFVCSNVGYVIQVKKIDLTRDVQFNFEMPPKITTE
ncbi:MAG TPA: carboxypeptidase-like regulatory domain-containing protein, partial [Chitinophagaceae bacterium]|nr:carboxypeptidase-like regulatory domain-containing protein [Chitinophagaceae bacterium]